MLPDVHASDIKWLLIYLSYGNIKIFKYVLEYTEFRKTFRQKFFQRYHDQFFEIICYSDKLNSVANIYDCLP